MKVSLLWGVLCAVSGALLASDCGAQELVPAGCDSPRPATSGHAFYVDPEHGDMRNDGSQRAPWQTLEQVVKARLIVTPQNPRGVVHPGDVIFLRSGDHGTVAIAGIANSDFITVAADKGQTPVLKGLRLTGAARWIFRGLTIQNLKGRLVEFYDEKTLGPTENVIFEGNHVMSQPDVGAWSQKDWIDHAAEVGLIDQAVCVTIRGNEIRNVRHGMWIFGSRMLIKDNVIDNFGDDAIDIAGSQLTLVGNRITNNHDLGDGNHNDGIQGWTVTPGTMRADNGVTNRDVLIEGNTIIQSTNPTPQFPDYLQGISYFDGRWENYRVINNVIVTYAVHGIAVYGGNGIQIVNNTLVGLPKPNTTDPNAGANYVPEIGVHTAKPAQGGTPPTNIVVRNNLAAKLNLAVSGVVADHNVIVKDAPAIFVRFDVAHGLFDLRLRPGSPAIGAGDGSMAPVTDITGAARGAKTDAGAYAASSR